MPGSAPASAPRARSELGDFLRARRARLTPREVGLPERPRRRTPGLRREEVAALAGLGIDWYVRLEQGRCVRPSTATLDALAAALRLSDVERAHLRTLARSPDRPPFARERVPPALRALIEALREPAYLVGRRFDVLAWNRAADQLFRLSALPEADRNTLVMLTRPASRRVFGRGWAEQLRRLLSDFRTSYDLWSDDPAFVALVARLEAECPEFGDAWRRHDVGRAALGSKRVRHPTLGSLELLHASFQSYDEPDLRLVLYVRADRRAQRAARAAGR